MVDIQPAQTYNQLFFIKNDSGSIPAASTNTTRPTRPGWPFSFGRLCILEEIFRAPCSQSVESAPLAGFLVGDAVADVIDALEGRDDFFIVGDDDDRRLVAPGHVVQDADHGHRTL